MFKKTLFIFSLLLALASCGQQGWRKTSNGIVVTLEKSDSLTTRQVRLAVVSENVIRVSATPGDFSKDTSLIVAQKPVTAKWTAEEEKGYVKLSTDSLCAYVSLKSGAVRFTDVKGNELLKEPEAGEKSFKAIEVEGTKGYSFMQAFDSPDDEAFYGLGQHQADEFNYKGKNEELFQYNTKVSIPFIMSSKNYGILWDNYSLTRFGDPRPYEQLTQFKLFDKNGKEGGLTASYYANADADSTFVVRTENKIDYENLETVKNFPQGFPFDHARIVWEGDIQPASSGVYRFLLYYAGYTKIWVDNQLMADKWRTAWNPSVAKFSVNMNAGERHHVRLEWKPDGGISYIGLRAHSPRDPKQQNQLTFSSEMGDQIDYYFVRGHSMDNVMKNYRAIVGKAQVMPKWAMGFWQSRERYKTQSELLDALKELRRRGIPVDNMVEDWSYWPENAWGSHDFDAARFPDPKGMVDQAHALNAHVMISVWPKFYMTTEHFKQFQSKGWMYMRAVKDSVRDWIGKGYIGSFYDAYSPGARKLFWKQMQEKLYPMGFDAWWMDASEPDILSNASMDYRKALMTPTALGPSTKYFNAYAYMNAMAIYNGQRGVNPDKRVFLLTRSGFAGLQKYGAATWSGDIGTCWEDMKAQIAAGLNYSISGNPYWTMDIGGFCVQHRFEMAKEGSADQDEWRELNTRWTQFGAFAPLFRTHGQFPYREVYNIAPESHPAYKTILYYDKLRYRLMPYIYSLAGKVWLDDYTIMRPMVMDFESDAATFDIGDQFMFGPSLLVAPVYTYKARSREVYFPKGSNWFDFYSGRYQKGGSKVKVDAPYERMPLYVREGSIIPIGEEIQYASEKPAAPITLYVYAGRDASFTLYEDEGSNYDYEKGKYTLIPIQWNDQASTLTIGARKGTFGGMVTNRTFNVVIIRSDKILGFDKSPKPQTVLMYNGSQLTKKM